MALTRTGTVLFDRDSLLTHRSTAWLYTLSPGRAVSGHRYAQFVHFSLSTIAIDIVMCRVHTTHKIDPVFTLGVVVGIS